MQKVWPMIGGLQVHPPKNEKTEAVLPTLVFTGAEELRQHFKIEPVEPKVEKPGLE